MKKPPRWAAVCGCWVWSACGVGGELVAVLGAFDCLEGQLVIDTSCAGAIGHAEALHQVQAHGFKRWACPKAQELRQGGKLGFGHRFKLTGALVIRSKLLHIQARHH